MSISNNVVAATQSAKVKNVKTVKTAKSPIEAKPSETGKALVKRFSELQSAKKKVSFELTYTQSSLSYWMRLLADAKSSAKLVAELNAAYDLKITIDSVTKLNAPNLVAKMTEKQQLSKNERVEKFATKYPESKGKYQGWTKATFLNAVCSFYRPVKVAKP